MQSQQFCYWLQGSFELYDNTSFDEKQTKIIKEHLNLVFTYDKQPNGFCNFLKGYLALSNPKNIDTEATAVIRTQLSETFKNEIDPTYPVDEQKQLNEIHNGDKPRFEAMC